MQRPLIVRLGILIASVFFAFAGACTKQEARKDNGGSQNNDPPSDPGPKNDNPCLRMKLVQDEDADEDADQEAEEGDKEDEETAKEENSEAEEDGIGSTSSSSGCDDDNGGDTPPPSTPSPGSLSGSWNPGPGKDGCEEKGQAWIAVKNGGPGECGASLVKWCCSATEIANRFPSVAAKLTPKIDDIVSGGLKLYHCSEDAGKTTFHFASGKGGGVQYKTLYVSATNSKDGDTKGDSCPEVTMEDMGFTAGGSDPGTTTEIPKSIGELDDTSKTALLDFLKAGEYNPWTGDANVRDTAGPHGKVKIFFNTKLKNGLDADKTEQDVGSIAVKEIYKDDGTTLHGYSIMAKHKAGEGKDTWFFYEVLGGAPDFKEVKAYAVGGPALCADCHKSGKDYIKSKPQP